MVAHSSNPNTQGDAIRSTEVQGQSELHEIVKNHIIPGLMRFR